MEEENKKGFTGVWIPHYIMEDKELSPIDKLVYAEIACFPESCFMTNESLANLVGCSLATVKRTIKGLLDKQYIILVGFDGRKRHLKASILEAPIGSKRAGRQLKMSRQVAQIEPIYNKDNINDITTPIKKDDASKQKLLTTTNSILNRKFRILPRNISSTMKAFTLEEISQALKNIYADEWHRQKIDNGELSLDYLLRPSTIDKFLNVGAKETGKSWFRKAINK